MRPIFYSTQANLTSSESILLVPSAVSEGSQRVTFNADTSYREALVIIYDIIGCTDVSKKPGLSYRLSSSAVKSDPINLGSSSDWDGCIEDVAAAEKKKKGVVVTVKILVPDLVSQPLSMITLSILILKGLFVQYLDSLRARTKKSVSTKNKRKPLLNLDNDEEEDAADVEMQEMERSAMEQLEKSLSQCQRCGDTKSCKIDRCGNHVNLTFQQRRSWSIAIVRYQFHLFLFSDCHLIIRQQVLMV